MAYLKYLTYLLIIFLAVTGPQADAAISCGVVLTSLSPCIGYLQRGGAITPSCCAGAKSLNNAAKTTPDLQAACRCIQTLVPSVRANPSFVNSLPQKCGINIPYNYSPSLDCSK
ncbi:hypothetical protein CDL12_05924 [Handroanthus impetiginosus]|uniref:Non-specific lipid-transfer protein n=1 Tax=Handroanthus impetiginosus TaxID=429701 RepID=A0A2G9HV33_9LAMI|nr:hypothetical protein CDL12_05924 [Handroanthus impetiginosus]